MDALTKLIHDTLIEELGAQYEKGDVRYLNIDDETKHVFVEGSPDMEALATAVSTKMQADFSLFTKLVESNWFEGPETLVVTRAKAIKLGHDTFSGERLREVLRDYRPGK